MSTNSEIGKSASLYCWSRENFLKAFEYFLGCTTIVVGFGGVWRPHSPLCSRNHALTAVSRIGDPRRSSTATL